jgi:hypothetical protein
LDVQLELGTFRQRVFGVVIVILPVLIGFPLYVEFDRVVSCCDSIDIPLLVPARKKGLDLLDD